MPQERVELQPGQCRNETSLHLALDTSGCGRRMHPPVGRRRRQDRQLALRLPLPRLSHHGTALPVALALSLWLLLVTAPKTSPERLLSNRR